MTKGRGELLRLGRRLRGVALGMTVVLAAGLASVPPAQADPPNSSRPKVSDNERTVKGKDLKVRSRTSDPAAKPGPAAKARWPKSGSAEVSVSGESDRAGSLPVWVGPPGSASRTSVRRAVMSGPAKVAVLDREAARRAGVEGVVFTLAPTGKGSAGRVGVRMDYSAFAQAFGGAYGPRLRLVQLPACALSTPDKPECRTSTPAVGSANNAEAQRLTADVDTTAGPVVLAAAAAPQGSQGDYKATTLEASATWKVSGNTGDFTWSYPMRVPPTRGGLAPQVGLGYSAQSVDGRTANTNSQPSWAGEGFDLWPGFIERRYKSCDDDGVPDGPGGKPPEDLCWGYDNATVTWNGKGGELVKAENGTWRLKNDDGTRFERLISADTGNGDNEGEYWKVTTTDGTRYYFGLNRLPGHGSGGAETNSAWTVPVFGDDSGEPCNKASGFADSWCQQAWRWNLDLVVDPNDNAIAYYYDKEINRYGRNLAPADATPYVRGGYLKSIEYGLRGDNVHRGAPPARVLLENSERCIPDEDFDCAPSKIDTDPDRWWDVPWDMNCEAGTECRDGHGSTSPTFWSRKRLTKVSTQLNRGSGWGYRDIDSWKLEHSWGAVNDERDLLAKQIQHTGHAGPQGAESIALPKVTFNHTSRANRLDQAGDGLPPYTRYRVSKIFDESGGELDIDYSTQECSRSAPPTPQSNTKRCFPTISHPPGQTTPITDWFNKYVVTSVVQKDRTGGAPDMATRYQYLGGAAWHFDDDDGLTREKHKTWSQWRGYGQVRVTTGSADQPSTQTDSYHLRGMHGDRAGPAGGSKDVRVPDGEGGTHVDAEALDGFDLKTVKYLAPGGAVHSKTVNAPWRHQTAIRTRSWSTITANAVQIDNTRTWTAMDGGTWRETKITSDYETDFAKVGRVKQTSDLGDVTVNTDDKCTRTGYADNLDKGMVSSESRVETVAVACATDPDRSKHVVADVRSFYDNGDFGESPSKGNVTRTEVIAEHDGSEATYVTDKKTGYDSYGRPLTITDAAGQTTTTRFTDNFEGLTTKTTVTTPPAKPGDSSTALSRTEELDPAWGQPIVKFDANGLRTDLTYDALGRSTKVWLPDRSKAEDQTPNLEFSYRVADGQIVAVTTKTLTNSGGQRPSIELYDGWLRSRQTQTAGPEGRLITDTFYDDRGQIATKYATYSATGAPERTLFEAANPGDIETQTRHTYDGLGRQTVERLLVGNGSVEEKWRTTTTYGGNWTAIDPPKGGIPTAEYTNARDKVIERRQYQGDSPSGAHDATTYAHDPAGHPTTITDASGNTWTNTYDLRGRKTKTTDPDRGTTTLTYDDLDHLTSTTDARDKTIFHTYDGLDRKTETREGSAIGRRLASWTFDTATRGKGMPAASTRHGASGDYTTQIPGYDVLGRPEATTITIPAPEGALAGSYTFTQSYNLDGTPKEQGLPAVGGLAKETLTHTYDDYQRSTRLTSDLATYVATTDYTPTGKPKLVEFGTSGKRAWNTLTWEHGTQRLANSRTHRENLAGSDRNAAYTYDDAGNILAIADVSSAGTDNQCFTYDHLRRLTQAWTQSDTTCSATPTANIIGGPAPYWRSFTYDTASNRTSETRHGTGGEADTTRAYTYNDPGQGSRLRKITQTGGAGDRTDTFTYDPTGNTTERTLGAATQTLDWDTEGLLTKTTEGDATTSFIYDADGERLIRKDLTGATLYLPGTELRSTTGAPATATRYYIHNDQTVAMRDNTRVRYLTGDHQNTSLIAINAADQKAIVRRYTPFGKERGAVEQETWPDEKGFVSGTKDPTGLTHLGAREYDPDSGRFISVDPLFNMDHPQSWNGYSYANNSPVTQSDPGGLDGPLTGNVNCLYTGKGCDDPKPHGGWQGEDLKYPVTFPELPEGQYRQDQYRRRIQQYREAPLDPKNPAEAQSLRMRVQAELAYCAEFSDDASICGKGNTNIHDSLDALGMAGMDAADIANALIYLREGKFKDALLSGIAVVPFLGSLAVAKRMGKGATRCSSFVPGTTVLMADGTHKPIDQIEVGDQVLATDPGTGETQAKTVLDTITSDGDKNLVQISVGASGNQLLLSGGPQPETTGAKILKNADHSGLVIATDTHPFWVAGHINKWIKAADLKPGMWLRTSAGTHVQVTATKTWTTPKQRVHNLTIADTHTYHVLAGITPILVHNDVPCVPGVGDVPRKVANSNMGHIDLERAERAGFGTISEARQAVRDLGESIQSHGFPTGTIADTAHSDRVLVPLGENGYAVYQIKPNNNAVFKTILTGR